MKIPNPSRRRVVTKSSTELSRRDAVVEEYAQLAPIYETRWSFYVEATIRETLARLVLRGDEHVLDIGCGTGMLLRQLASRYPAAHLTGVDPVAEMLAIARQSLPPRVELCLGWAEALPFGAAPFDVIVSTNVLHYLGSPLQALSEMRRVLRPGGRLVLTDWCDDYLMCRACDLWLRATRRVHNKVYRAAELETMLRDAGFPDVAVKRYKINWLWGLMTAQAG